MIRRPRVRKKPTKQKDGEFLHRSSGNKCHVTRRNTWGSFSPVVVGEMSKSPFTLLQPDGSKLFVSLNHIQIINLVHRLL